MLAVLGLLIASQSIALPFERDVLVTDAGALLLMRPLHIAGPEVRQFSWSPNGKLLAVLEVDEAKILENFLPSSAQAKLAPESTVRVWNSETRKTQEVVRKRGLMVGDISWMAGEHLFVSTVEPIPSGPNRPEPGMRAGLLRWSSGKSAVSVASEELTGQGDGFLFTSSRKIPYGIVMRGLYENGTGEGLLVTPSGPAKPIRVPMGWIRSDREGRLINFSSVPGPTPGQRVRAWSRLELNGTWTSLPAMPNVDEPRVPEPRGAEFSTSVTAFGAAQVKLVNGWLTGRYQNKPSAALVAADSDRVELSPDGKYAIYQSQGNLFARPIRPISLEEYEKMVEAAEKMELMSRAKQIGTAAQIYASDNKDHFPPKSGFSDSIMPYLRSAEMMQGFVYEMDGDNISAIPNVAEAVMGYIQGKGGRAVVYADSHVKWIPDKKP
jgi:hypothetical protein